MIDPHVHLRDWNWRHKDTLEHGLIVAEKAGLDAVFDMPNTEPAITTRELVKKRLRDADKVSTFVFYGLYVGLTANVEQIREAVRAYRGFFPNPSQRVGVVGLKMFAGRSVGSLSIVEEEKQKLVYRTLAEEGYKGVLAVHCEKESLFKPELWNPSDPVTHSLARPKEAEIESVRDQINFALETGYAVKGRKARLHILHVSVPETVELVDEARKSLNITCGVTPHHCVLSTDYMSTDEGILGKVNPPLRSSSDAVKMLEALINGDIDWIESDHAPHTLAEKTGKYMSGFPGLPFYPWFLKYLGKRGVDEAQIRRLTHTNIEKVFGIYIFYESRRKVDYNLQGEYEVDVYKGVRERMENES